MAEAASDADRTWSERPAGSMKVDGFTKCFILGSGSLSVTGSGHGLDGSDVEEISGPFRGCSMLTSS